MLVIQLIYVYRACGSQPETLQKKAMISVPEIMEYIGFDTSQEDILRRGEILSKSISDREKTAKELAMATVMIIGGHTPSVDNARVARPRPDPRSDRALVVIRGSFVFHSLGRF